MPRFDVVGFGIVTIDHIGVLDHYPAEDTKQRLRMYVQQGGGTVGTPLVACARLGLNAAYIGRIGDGPSSRAVLDDFRRERVDTTGVVSVEGYEPPVGLILVNPATGSRTICWYGSDSDILQPEELNRDVVESSSMLYLDAREPLASVVAAGWAHAAGRKVFIDADNVTEGIADVLPLCDTIIASQNFALKYFGNSDPERAARKLHKRFGVVCGVTAGSAGSFLATPGESFWQPAFEVDVVDTTGAGDVYHGAFAMGLLRGWPLRDIACFASAVAAMKCRELGGRSGIPRFAEACAFLKERGMHGAWEN
ncbi:MAG: Ribokinase [Candidatus Latescibacteria bacterium ADurb.Bin168]|nr:MAG: Ribokinase [Candidatus Latescibacteria bacterium ADurb.Bin168]